MTIGQIRVHQGLHMPSGGDPLPWLGTYPRAAAGDPGGIHMIGTLAERPAPSAGTQQGSDGFLSPTLTSFNSPSGRFSSAYSGETLTITDPQDFTTTSYTVTYVSNNQLALSSAYSGATGVTTGAPNPTVNWVLEGPPSNAGLLYYATDGP